MKRTSSSPTPTWFSFSGTQKARQGHREFSVGSDQIQLTDQLPKSIRTGDLMGRCPKERTSAELFAGRDCSSLEESFKQENLPGDTLSL